MNIVAKQKRSEIMSKEKSENANPEILVRKALFEKGFKYCINVKSLLGSLDIVLKNIKWLFSYMEAFSMGMIANIENFLRRIRSFGKKTRIDIKKWIEDFLFFGSVK